MNHGDRPSAVVGAAEGRSPYPFVGRDAELERVGMALDATPVVAIGGAAGVGKTALAFAVCARRRNTGPATLVDLDAELTGNVVERLLMRLATRDVLPPDWRVLGAEPDLARMTLVDVADHRGWTVVLDDLTPRHANELYALLLLAQRYATRSRWIVTARRCAELQRRGVNTLELDELEDVAAMQLLASCAPATTPAERAELLRRAGRIPGALLHASHSMTQAPNARASRELRATLAVFARPIATQVVADVTGLSSDEIERIAHTSTDFVLHAGGIWLRTDAREELTLPSDAELIRLAELLARDVRDETRVEAIRLLLLAGRAEQALALLGDFGEAACERGLAADLWRVLDGALRARPDFPDALYTWRAWCGFEWGDPRAQPDIERYRASVEIVPATYLEAHLAARLAIAVGDFDRAASLARHAAQSAATVDEHDRAWCRAMRAVFSAGRPTEALEMLEARAPSTPAGEVESSIIRIESLAMLGELAESMAESDRLLGRLATFAPALRLRALLGVARACLMQHRLRDAERMVDALLALRGDGASDAVSARTALEIASAVAAQRGRFAQVREIASRLLTFERIYPVRALFTRTYLAVADRWQRHSPEFRESCTRLMRDATENTSPIARDIVLFCDALLSQCDMIEGVAPARPSAIRNVSPTAPMALTRDRYRQLHEGRWGVVPEREAADEDDDCDMLFRISRAATRLLAGDAEAANIELTDVLERAIESGRRLIEFETRLLLLWVQVERDELTRLREQCDALRELGTALDAPRLIETAEFFAGAQTAAPAGDVLERWAGAPSSGAITRLSRWLLGHEACLDRVEEIGMRALVSRHRWRRAVLLAEHDDFSSTRHARACGVDFARKTLWSREGETCDLGQHEVLWQIVSHLAASGGSASKESLVRAVWAVDEYHPLHHDNRLRVAVRKLRDRLADRFGNEYRDAIVTTGDGYAMAGPWRLLGSR